MPLQHFKDIRLHCVRYSDVIEAVEDYVHLAFMAFLGHLNLQELDFSFKLKLPVSLSRKYATF